MVTSAQCRCLQIWILKEGWLSKRSSGRMTHGTWQRRWFVLQSDGTLYHLSSQNGQDRKAVVNLCISTIKHDLRDREKLCFSLVSPSHTYSLQADSASERQSWIDSIQVRCAGTYLQSSTICMRACSAPHFTHAECCYAAGCNILAPQQPGARNRCPGQNSKQDTRQAYSLTKHFVAC